MSGKNCNTQKKKLKNWPLSSASLKDEYSNYLAHDQGPGSSTSVEATCRARVIGVWKDMPESFSEDLLKGGYGLYLQEDSSDGYYEYSYTLECAEMGTDSWKWQGIVSRHEDDYWVTASGFTFTRGAHFLCS